MSLNGGFKAFSPEDIQAMNADRSLIDAWAFDNDRVKLKADVDGAWDVLQTVLRGAGFSGGELVTDALSMGCFIMSPEEVNEQVDALSRFSPSDVETRVDALDPTAEIYRLELYRVNKRSVLDAFDRLVDFYRQAASQGLGAISYIA